MDFACVETPEMIQHREDWVNRTLRDTYPDARVCLHADRTTSVWRSDADGQGWIRTECDYCPSFTITLTSCTVHLAAWYFTDGPAAL